MISKELLKLELQDQFQDLKEKTIQCLPWINKKRKSEYSLKKYFNQIRLKSDFNNLALKTFFGNHAQGILYNTSNGILTSSPEDIEINSKLGSFGQYDLDKIFFLKSLISKSSVVYFLGAHIGTLLVPLSKIAKKVIGFEANPRTFPFLKNNVLINECVNTSIFNLGVYDKTGYAPFYQNKANTGGSKIKPAKDSFIYNYDNPDQTIISTVRLDEFQKSQDLPLPDLMVVDIEGSEYCALKEATNCLAHSKYLYIEFVPHHLSDVANISIKTFLSVITPFFNKMIIVGYEQIFEGSNIDEALNLCYSNGSCIDLLFFKN